MENLIGRFAFTFWKNGDFHDRWLRRINRQTKTQYVSDCQRCLDVKENKQGESTFSKFKTRATKFRSAEGRFVWVRPLRANSDGTMDVKLVDDFSILDTDWTLDSFTNEVTKLGIDDTFKPVVIPANELTYGNSVNPHLRDLFGDDIEIYTILDSLGDINVTHEETKLAQTSTKYHITIHGGEKDKIFNNENRHNRTIAFWKFGNILVWKFESGIGSW